MKIRFAIFLFLFSSLISLAQITTTPQFPKVSQAVTIRFNSSEETRLNSFSGDLYAHTGVLVHGKTDWQHVIGTWGNNTLQPKLNNLGGGIYELQIAPSVQEYYNVASNERILKMAFVFRSADGTKQTNDLLVDVYPDGLVATVTAPANGSIVALATTVNVKAQASATAQLTLKVNDNVVKTSSGTSIEAETSFTQTGENTIVLLAQTDTETKTDTSRVYVRTTNPTTPLPALARQGIQYLSETSARLVLWAPHKSFVYLLGDFNNWKIDNSYLMNKAGDYFWFELNNLESGKSYAFQYLIDGTRRVADPYTEVVSDPWNDSYITASTYPNLMAYPEGKTTGIASVLQTNQPEFQWEVENFTVPAKEKMVIYELHIRDFDAAKTYKAVRERLDYLQDLNVNVLELMPVNEFEGNSSWGYNPSFYFAPDKAYGPKEELKKLIDECHKRGIAVVIDMVLNHSYGQSPFAQMYMDDNWTITADNPWYNVESNFKNTSLTWGYDFNHESAATRALIDSVNSFWINEYKVDGFRFDFTKGFSNTPYSSSSWGSEYDAPRVANLKRMADEIWKRKSDALVILEHLADNSEEKVLANYGMMLWGNMNHNYNEATMGYNEGGKSDLSWGVYTARNWNAPNLVTYMESHDEERLMFKNISYGAVQGTYNTKLTNTALDRMELASAFFIPLPGPKMIWQFGELGYDISIDFNGRVGEKPVKWTYTSDLNRTDLFRVLSKLNFLKQNYEEFNAGALTHNLTGEVKWYKLTSGNNHVLAVGNFGTVPRKVTVTFQKTGTWYNYFARTAESFATSTQELTLAPGEYRLYTSRELEHPHIQTNIEELKTGENRLRLYPNPVQNVLHVETELPARFEIFSLWGQSMGSPVWGESEAQIDVNPLARGVYLLRIDTNGRAPKFQKFIKE